MPHAFPHPGERGRTLGGCLLIAGIFFAVVAGCGFFAYRHFTGLLEDEIVKELEGNPVVEEHLGDIQEVDLDMQATGELTQGQDEEDEKLLVFAVTGSKGQGQVRVVLPPKQEKDFRIRAATLVLPSGETFDLGIGSAAEEEDAQEGDAQGAPPEEAPAADDAAPQPAEVR